jgi:hypothetical protein
VQGCGEADRVVGMIKDWWDTCPGHRRQTCGALLPIVLVVEPQPPNASVHRFWLDLSLKTRRCSFGGNQRQ